MMFVLSTLKRYWKFLVVITTVVSSLLTAAVWVGKVDRHVTQGDQKIEEFNRSQIQAGRVETKVDVLMNDVSELKTEIKEIKKQNEQILKKLRR